MQPMILRQPGFYPCGKLRVSIETALQNWSKSSRPIVNAIIYYRTLRLSRVFR